MKMTGHTAHSKVKGTMVYLEPDRRCRPRCHVCGRPGTIHTSGRHRAVKDLAIADHEVVVQFSYRTVWCAHCNGARVEQLDFTGPSMRITYRLANYMWGLCNELPLSSVARRFGLDPKTVKALDYEKLKQHYAATDTENLRLLAIDEIAIKKGHTYMTVVLDYETGRVVWMGKGRRTSTLATFFAQLTDSQKKGIQAVAMDMWQPYIKAVQEHLPGADIVFDLFHIVQGFNRVIDTVRRSEYRKASEQDKQVIKGSRYLLLKNQENLSVTDKRNEPEELQRLLDLNEKLNAVYILKDDLKRIYQQSSVVDMAKALLHWCIRAESVGDRFVTAFSKRLKKHAYGILAYCDWPISTGPLEGANNKIKVLKRIAYGFHDEEYFVLKVKQALPGRKAG
jgi:transposase